MGEWIRRIISFMGWVTFSCILVIFYGLFLGYPSIFFAVFSLIVGYVVMIRPWMMCWGAVEAELESDDKTDSAHLSRKRIVCVHAITVNRPAAEVWPWLLQIGYERAGLFSYSFVDRLFAVNPLFRFKLAPRWSRLVRGQTIVFFPKIWTALVHDLVAPKLFRFGNIDVVLVEKSSEQCRVVIRTSACSEPNLGFFFNLVLWHFFWEILKFLLERKLLLTIKQLVESGARSSDNEIYYPV